MKKNINVLTTLICSIYHAEVIPAEEARRWLDKDEEFVVGFRFPDLQKAYYLMTLNDARILTREQYEFHAVHQEYPFPDMRFIVYKDKNGEYGYRITKGVASALDNLIESWENWED